jgi:hypothetical protein
MKSQNERTRMLRVQASDIHMLSWKPNWLSFDTVAWNNLFMEFANLLIFILKMSQNFIKYSDEPRFMHFCLHITVEIVEIT